jgi:hypothetical protein
MGLISGISSSYVQSILGNVVDSIGLTGTKKSASGTSTGASQTDSQQLSPLAQMMSTLEQLQQTNPSQYKQVTQQIATNLQTAAQTDQAAGNSTGAAQLNQLATDFSNGSQNGQLPNMQSLVQALSGEHQHGYHSSTGSQSGSTDPMAIIQNALSTAGISS